VESTVDVVSLDRAFESFTEIWSPRIVSRVNDYDVKIARGDGEFPEHDHPETDEFFLVLAGTLHLDLPDRTVTLHAGEVFTVPRGMRHRPRAQDGARFLMFEPRGTVNTGDPATGTTGVPLG
jgi:mannose-6-phosphate isomerase-like protein (cupin superfamily)